jgi:hypothetical protein
METKMNIYLKNFIEALKEYDLTFEEVQQNYRYSGGDHSSRLNYFNLCMPTGTPTPEKVFKCLCGHDIKRNCYITKDFDVNTILILGNCCIKRFEIESSRTCKTCKKPHKNRNVNRCNDCRIGLCDTCDRKIHKDFKKCWRCKNK